MNENFVGIGIDIVEIARFRNLIDESGDRFLNKWFTTKEINYCNNKANRYQHYAGKFSAKEAVCKALEMNWKDGLHWKDIEIINNENGIPRVLLSGKAKEKSNIMGVEKVLISISHCKNYATAVATLIGENRYGSYKPNND